MNTQDTICAIATAQGGALGIIRVSGSDAITITDKIFSPIGSNATPLTRRKAYTLNFGHIKNEKGEIIDEVLVSLFHAPHSYTGENSTEISCHGSIYILQQVMCLLIANGCRTASPGEFTKRAFLNGKMDLSQAEAVADVISSSSEASHRLAINQMRGGFSKELSNLREQLLHLTSLMELELDFSDHEELEFADRNELDTLTVQIEKAISRLVNSFNVGNAIKNGIPVAIIGETNAGKSTLLNALLNEDKAIVSNIHGTTRDIIEDTININGIMFRFIDTAGIRKTNDQIENIGIERSFQALEQAQIVILMYDLQQSQEKFQDFLNKIIPHLQHQKVVLTMNKCDIVSEIPSFSNIIPAEWNIIPISAQKKYHISELQDLLTELAGISPINSSDIIITNARHYEALSYALEAIHRVREGIAINLSGDFISQDLRECIFYLNDIMGEVTTDQVLGNIFMKFCIGK